MSVAMIGPKFYGWDKDGNPLAFGKVFTYQARTNNPKETFQSEDGIVANTNPVILNGEGYANIYLDGSYKIVLKDRDDNEIWTADPVTASEANEWNNCLTANYVSSTSFKVSGNFVAEYEVGRRVRIDNDTATFSYGTILTSTFAASETTVTIKEPVVSTQVREVCGSIVGPESVGVSNFEIQDTSKPHYFDTKSLMAASSIVFPEGKTLITKGYFIKSDGGGADYIVNTGVNPEPIGNPNLSGGGYAKLQTDEHTVNMLTYGLIADGATDQKSLIETAAAQDIGDPVIPNLPSEVKLSGAPNVGAKSVHLSRFDQVDPSVLKDMQAFLVEKGRVGGAVHAPQFKKWGLDVVGGTIRKVAVGGDKWKFINTVQGEAGHETIGWDPSILYTAGGTDLILPYNIPNGNGVISVVAGPDEFLASQGVTVGASVADNSIRLQMSFDNRIGKSIEWNGTSFDVVDIYGDSITLTTASPNRVRIKHPRMGARDITLLSAGSAFPHLPSFFTNISADEFEIKFADLINHTLNPSFSTSHNFLLYLKSRSLMILNGGSAGDTGDKILTQGNIWIHGIRRIA